MGIFNFFKPQQNNNKVSSAVENNSGVPEKITVKVVGTEYRNLESILSLVTPNPDYQLDKRAMVNKYPDGNVVYEYIFQEQEASFEFEPTNEYDPNAIKVVIRGIHVGYVKKGSCSRIRNLINQGEIESISAKITGGNNNELYRDIDDGEMSLSDFVFSKNKGAIRITLTLTLRGPQK